MSRAYFSLGANAAVLSCLLFAAAAHAQSSPLGHVPARSTYPPYVYAGAPAFRVYPGDKGFQATMKIEHYYQDVERAAPLVATRRVWRPPVPTEPVAAPIDMVIAESTRQAERVTIRSPDGSVRSFPVAAGRDVIRPRTIVLRPGDRLTLVFQSARVQAPKK